jgi:hypothetical protein
LALQTFYVKLLIHGDFTKRVSSSTETETYGKGVMGQQGNEQQTFPRRSFFGKDKSERSCLFKGLQTLFSPLKAIFSGRLRDTTILGWHSASP